MPRKTNSDIIRDVERHVAILDERIENLRRGIAANRDLVERLRQQTGDHNTRLKLVEQRLNAIETRRKSRENYFWMLTGVILGAVLTFLLSLLNHVLRGHL